MTQSMDRPLTEAAPESDLSNVMQGVLSASTEPLTLPKLRARLPASLRKISLEQLADYVNRQVAANVLYQYPRYRSQHDRFWDRPMSEHVSDLLHTALRAGPLAWVELRRKLPAYALPHAESVLLDHVNVGKLHRHPRNGNRGRERFGAAPADPKDYLRSELANLFRKLEPLGFTQAQLRSGALELLHEEEWSSPGLKTTTESCTTPEAFKGAVDQAPTQEMPMTGQADALASAPAARNETR